MEASLFIPDKPKPEFTCALCGETFRPHSLAEGFEELCNHCYEAQFRNEHETVTAAPKQEKVEVLEAT